MFFKTQHKNYGLTALRAKGRRRESLTAQSPATRSIWRERNKAGEWLTTGSSL
jgi:hypothetical protein